MKHTSNEEKAEKAILDAMDAIKYIRGRKHPLSYNNAELAQAIHVLQSFTKQAVLNRLYPTHYSDWWKKDG